MRSAIIALWALTALAVLAPVDGAKAQTADTAVITWRAATFTPAFYTGKALPVPGSKIVAAVDVLRNGKPVDLANQTVYWYLNDKFITGGTGITRLALTIPDAVLSSIKVRAALPEYNDGLAKTETIPVANPVAVIDSRLPDKKLHASSATLLAWPFFFNVKSLEELSFDWLANGNPPSSFDDPDKLNLSIQPGTPKGSTFTISLKVSNPRKAFEFGKAETNLTFEP